MKADSQGNFPPGYPEGNFPLATVARTRIRSPRRDRLSGRSRSLRRGANPAPCSKRGSDLWVPVRSSGSATTRASGSSRPMRAAVTSSSTSRASSGDGYRSLAEGAKVDLRGGAGRQGPEGHKRPEALSRARGGRRPHGTPQPQPVCRVECRDAPSPQTHRGCRRAARRPRVRDARVARGSSRSAPARPKRRPRCPSSPCLAVSRTTGYQAKVVDSREAYVVPAAGRIVAWTIGLGSPDERQIEFFEDNYGEASAGLTRPAPRQAPVPPRDGPDARSCSCSPTSARRRSSRSSARSPSRRATWSR